MKRFAYILILVIALSITLSSCNRKANCPAYRTHLDHEQTINSQVWSVVISCFSFIPNIAEKSWLLYRAFICNILLIILLLFHFAEIDVKPGWQAKIKYFWSYFAVLSAFHYSPRVRLRMKPGYFTEMKNQVQHF